MTVAKYAWLIGMTDASDERLLAWARSYAKPPRVAVTGGKYQGWHADRRAHQIVAAKAKVEIQIEPKEVCVNPVFELTDFAGSLNSVAKNGRMLANNTYRWDGRTLWLGRSPGQQGGMLDGLGALFLGTSLFGLGLVVTMSYVGKGIQPPMPALGSLLRDGMNLLQSNPTALLAPLFVLWACVVALYFAADALIGYFQDKGVFARLNE